MSKTANKFLEAGAAYNRNTTAQLAKGLITWILETYLCARKPQESIFGEKWSTATINKSENRVHRDNQSIQKKRIYLAFVDDEPIGGGEPLVIFDVVNAVFEVAVAFRQIHLEQIP